MPFAFGLLFGQAGPGDFRIGEHDGRNGVRLEDRRFASRASMATLP